MRKIVAGLFMSLDGVVGSPEQWQMPYFDHEMGAAVASRMAAADTLLLGRRTYEELATAFAGRVDSGDPMTGQMNAIPKLVASTTLDTVDWQNSSLIKGDLADELARIRTEPGKNLQVTGSITLTRWLLGHRLLDELSVMVCPVLVGRGRRLFDADHPIALDLTDATTFGSGVLSLSYRPPAAADPKELR